MSRFPLLFRSFSRGAIKRGWGTSGTFKVINLTYLHILRAGMVYITLWYVHVPRYVHIPLGSRYLLGQHKPPLKFNFKGILFYTIFSWPDNLKLSQCCSSAHCTGWNAENTTNPKPTLTNYPPHPHCTTPTTNHHPTPPHAHLAKPNSQTLSYALSMCSKLWNTAAVIFCSTETKILRILLNYDFTIPSYRDQDVLWLPETRRTIFIAY